MNDQFPSDRYCSMSGRSWTDLTTNAMFLSEVQRTGDLRKLFVSSKSPDHYRPVFLHEATHHWCFLSPVGSTLTYLRFRACKHALKAQKSPGALSDLLDDLVRYEVATSLMRPLAEGLALFAQFDATPSASSVQSAPLTWSLQFFKEDADELRFSASFDQLERDMRSLLLILADARLNEQTLKSKAALLAKRLQPSVDCYLAGYLFVKNLRRFGLSKSTRFLETDLFLTYLRNFFYHDLGLVAALLEPSISEIRTANTIAMAFQKRIDQFFASDLATNLARFEKEIAGLEANETTHFLEIFNNTPTARLGLERLRALSDEVLSDEINGKSDQNENDGEHWNILQQIQQNIFLRRPFMHLGSLPVSVSIDNDGLSTIAQDNSTFMALRLKGDTEEEKVSFYYNTPTGDKVIKNFLYVRGTPDATEGRGEGSIDLYFSVFNTYQVVTITREGKLVGSIFFDRVDPDSEAKRNSRAEFMELQRVGVQLEQIDKVDKDLTEALNEIVEKNWIKISLNHVKGSLTDIVDNLYLQYSLSFVPSDKLDECKKIMSKRGYYELLGKDRSTLEALALLDICCSLLPFRERLTEILAAHNVDLDTTIATLNKYSKQYGILEVIDLNDWLVCLI